jgi:hypothetical protein
MAKLYGPRLLGGRYYSKGKARGRPKTKYAKRSSTTRVKRAPPKMIKNIVKKQVMSMAETKYFNTSRLSTLTRLSAVSSRSLATAIDVRGFAVGDGSSPLAGSEDIIDYGFIGGQGNPDVIPLNMVRAFGNGNTTQSLRKNSIEGAYVSPLTCKSEWIIEFPQIGTTSDLGNVAEANPMFMRVVRVVPRMKKYSKVDIDPKIDLFVDQYGEAIGVQSAVFNQLELQMLKVNSRKYQVIQDYQKLLVPSSTQSVFAIGDGNVQVTNLTRYGNQCKLVFNHKQPKKLYYDDVDNEGVVSDGAQPQAGQNNELIFFHFTTIGNSGNVNTSNDIEITCKTVSTFKDI